MFSTNASCGPFTTISFAGFSTLRCLKPFTSMSKATDKVSINSAQFPRINARYNIRKFALSFYIILRH